MIETYNESDLHRQLKDIFTPQHANQEALLDGSICDVLCKSGKIIEIQTTNLSALRKKIEKFTVNHPLEIVYPIIENNFIRLLNADNTERRFKKSPAHGTFFQVFKQITGIWDLIGIKNLYFTLIYIDAETIKIDDGFGRSRKKRPRVLNRKLLRIHKTEKINTLHDLLIPILFNLNIDFTISDLIKFCPKKYASYVIWFLRKTKSIEVTGKIGRKNIYSIVYSSL